MQWSTNNPWLTLLIALMSISLGFCEDIYFAGNISCTERLEEFDNLHNKVDLIADCPSFCLAGFCRVRGSSPYAKSSSCCCAAIHHGSIKNELGGRIHIRINHRKVPPLIKSTQNGVTSRGYSSSSSGTFTFVAIAQPELERNNQTHSTQNVSSATVAIVTSPSVVTLETTSLPIMTSPRENKKNTTRPAPRPTTTTSATKSEPTMSTRKEQEGTSRSTTSRSFTRHHSDAETTTQIFHPNVTASDQRRLTIQHSHFVVSLVAAFSAGIVSTVIALFVFYKLRRRKRRKPRETRSRSHTEETEVCVCYTNDNEYQQKLLADPDTCIRPCPNRQLLESDSVTIEQDILMASAPSDDCSSGCSKRCHPAQFEF